MKATELKRQSFDDIDCYLEFFRQLGWELESTQLSRGTNRITYDHIAFPDLLIADHRVTKSRLDVFEIPDNHFVLSICRRASGSAMVNGFHLAPTMLAIVRPVGTYQVRIPDNFEAVEFTISNRLIERTGLFPPRYYDQLVNRQTLASLPLVLPQTDKFLYGVDTWLRRLRVDDRQSEFPNDTTEFYEFVLDGLQQVVDAGLAAGPGEVPPKARRADLVVLARELILENLSAPFTSDEIARSLGVSRRVLNYAFQHGLGIGTYQYVQMEKLHAARRKLKTGDSVTETCLAFGFSTPSRFARQYRRLFGELPSETLRGKQK